MDPEILQQAICQHGFETNLKLAFWHMKAAFEAIYRDFGAEAE